MEDKRTGWSDYGKLVLSELERLNDYNKTLNSNLQVMNGEINTLSNKINTIQESLNSNKKWIDRVNDVWSPSQMKEAKDEIYTQKNKWVAVIAILAFIEIALGLYIAISF